MASSPNPLSQFQKLVQSISMRQRILIGGTALAIGIGVALFVGWQRNSDYRPLYTSLAAEDAGAIVQKLKEKNTPYRITDGGGTIQVPSARVAEMRLEMAAAGLPKTGRIGFELFDKTHFGATDFMEHVNFRRALEGELERSVMGIGAVETARVHITFPKDSVFPEDRLPAKASVMVKLRPDAQLTPQNVVAVQYLAASAVEGLSPDQVSVLDMQGNLLGRPKEKGAIDGPEPSEAVIEYQQTIEKNLLAKVNATLTPLLGPDRFRASIVAECDFSSGDQSEESYDPTHSVMTQEQRSRERTTTANSTGVPGTESNLPRAVPRPGTNTGVARESSTIAYATSHIVKHVRLPQGSIKRLSASVLVDQTLEWQGPPTNPRRVLVPPSADELKRINDVVAAAIGLQAERGDRLVVETLPFENTLKEAPPPVPPAPEPTLYQKLLGDKIVLSIAAVCAVALLLIVFVRRTGTPAAATVAAALPALAPPAGASPVVGLPGAAAEKPKESLNLHLENQLHEQERALAMEAIRSNASKFEKLTREVAELSQKDPKLCANVLRTWLTESARS